MIASQLEIINQGLYYLNIVSKKEYQAIAPPNFISSSGSHMRHIIDHYIAIMNGIENNNINYDVRNRQGELAHNPVVAIEKLNAIKAWLKQLSPNDFQQSITLSTEVSITSKNVQQVQSSIARELVFAGSHAVHHYAMIAQISFAQQLKLPEGFGLAPATATFLREECA